MQTQAISIQKRVHPFVLQVRVDYHDEGRNDFVVRLN